MTVSEERAFELLKKMAFERVSGTGEELLNDPRVREAYLGG